jgi:hypothetical protein
MNVADLTATQKAELVQAFLDLKNPAKAPSQIPAAATAVTNGGGVPNRYDDYVWLHRTVGSGAHLGSAFGPWHREFLRQFEYDLQQVSGNHHLALPYWDWITARSAADAGWPFTNDLLGGFGNAGPGSTTGYVTAGPFADPTTWRISIRFAGDSDVTLKRNNGIPLAADLPDHDTARWAFGVELPPGVLTWPEVYDGSPYNDPNSGITTAQFRAHLRKFLEYALHNGVHGWVGGAWEFNAAGDPGDGGHMTFPAVSVNDPAFWLHHANVDRLWTIWQRKSPTTGYLPQVPGTANAGHNGGDDMVNLANTTWFNTPLLSSPNEVEDHHDLGYWYHSDIPEVAPDGLSVAFGTVPELLTTYHPIAFTVRTCRPVHFELTGVTGTGFGVPPTQGIVTVDHDDHAEFVTAHVYVRFEATSPVGVPQAGTATVRAYVTDQDGYDAPAPGAQFELGTWMVNLSATPVTRPRAAVSLVLDRSGSMWANAGAAGSQYDLLKESLAVARDVMRPIDGVGVVTFDDLTTVLDGITEMGNAPTAPGSGREVLEDAVASPDLVPRGLTGIGQGMIEGAAVLDAESTNAGTIYEQFGLVVMTDGNQNQSPSVTDPAVLAAIAPYADEVYAIGLGRPGGVSDAVLTSVSNYMLITGDMTAPERRFRLTKYFIQILAGITKTAIVVDPQGDLAIGSEHRIPFVLGAQDHQVDVIVLSPFAPILDVVLEAPDGTVVDGSLGLPTVEFQQNADDALYRLTLPLDPTITTAGSWTAVLRLPKDAADRLTGREDLWDRITQLHRTGTVPYSVIVQSYSDVRLDAEVRPSLVVAGDAVELAARLTAYGQAFTGRGRVLARVTDPAEVGSIVALRAQGDGTFLGKLTTSLPGVYSIRFTAEGHGGGVSAFQREELRTATAYRGEIPKSDGAPEEDKRRDGRDKEAPADEHGGVKRTPDHIPLATQPEPAAPRTPEPDSAVPPHATHDHSGHDHDKMFFKITRISSDFELVEVDPALVEKDTSDYVEGSDPGIGPDLFRGAGRNSPSVVDPHDGGHDDAHDDGPAGGHHH